MILFISVDLHRILGGIGNKCHAVAADGVNIAVCARCIVHGIDPVGVLLKVDIRDLGKVVSEQALELLALIHAVKIRRDCFFLVSRRFVVCKGCKRQHRNCKDRSGCGCEHSLFKIHIIPPFQDRCPIKTNGTLSLPYYYITKQPICKQRITELYKKTKRPHFHTNAVLIF